MVRFFNSLSPLITAAALITTAFAQTAPSATFRHEIKPGKIQEECRPLASGDRVAYRYTSTAPVAFNVHFHKANTVTYPVKIAQSRAEEGIFTASSNDEYCWMWTNGNGSPVVVEGELAAFQ